MISIGMHRLTNTDITTRHAGLFISSAHGESCVCLVAARAPGDARCGFSKRYTQTVHLPCGMETRCVNYRICCTNAAPCFCPGQPPAKNTHMCACTWHIFCIVSSKRLRAVMPRPAVARPMPASARKRPGRATMAHMVCAGSCRGRTFGGAAQA